MNFDWTAELTAIRAEGRANTMTDTRKYFVKAAMRTNLDSMHTSLTVKIFDIINGEYETTKVMGKIMKLEDLYEFRDEVDDLLNKATFGKVTGNEYGRIKAISDERNAWRYARCIASGMSEDRAAYAFME